MVNESQKERAAKALNALNDFGIDEKRVKPILKRLLKLYDNNWEPIEDENYRVLIDAIFEQEIEVAQLVDESSEPPLKRSRSRSQEDQVCSSGEGSIIRPKVEGSDCPIARRLRSAERAPIAPHVHDIDEDEAPPSSQAFLDCEEPSQLCTVDNSENDSVSPTSPLKDKRKEPTSSSPIFHREDLTQGHLHLKRKIAEPNSIAPQTHLRGKETESSSPRARSSHGMYFKEPKIEPGIVIQPREKLRGCRQNGSSIEPKSEPMDSNDPPFEIPIAIMAPSNYEYATNDDPVHIDGSTEDACSVEPLVHKRSDNGISVGACSTSTSSNLTNVLETHKSFEIASSSSGEVKISLNCNQTFERPDFSIPSLEAVLKAVEDKCLRSYRILEPKFSMQNLMQEMCQSFLELTSTPPNPTEDNCIHLTSDFDFLKKSNLQNAFAPKSQMPANLSNGSINLESSAETSPSTLLLEGVPNNAEGSDPNSSDSQSLILAPQDVYKVDEEKPLHDVNDISRGEEKVRISLINEVSSEPYPPKFYYISRNAVYQNAYVNLSLARIGDDDCCANCFGDCLSSSISCACARETGGEFAYTLEGLVKEKFLDECISMNRDPLEHRHVYCKECPLERSKEGFTDSCTGHLVRKFIKECWSKCGCNIQCGNRVVQRGISYNLQVFLTPEGKGWGLRTLEDLPRGSFVCEYVGEILTNTELYDRNMRSNGDEKHTYPVLLDADWGSEGVLKDEEALCLDATYYGNVARFINHRCFDGNLVEIPVEVETPDHHYYHLAFFTTRNVEALEELTWDYGIDFSDKNHPVKGFRCQCGSNCCRDMKRSHSE
ncbi:[histone H3]-lysine(4) N-trimethyltransferase [Ranunculus cassubicifolius]